MHILQILAVFGREGCNILCDLGDHPRIGFTRDVPAAEILGDGDDAERDRHPGFYARRRILLVGIAFDPDQFRGPAADVEQDGAPPVGIEQRRATDHGQRCLGLAVDHFQLDAGLARHPGPEAVGITGGAAGFGRDQPQAARPAVTDLVATDAQGGKGAINRRFADGTGRRDTLAQPDDPRKRIDHAESIAGGTGDQEPAIIGAKVERGVNATFRAGHSRP